MASGTTIDKPCPNRPFSRDVPMAIPCPRTKALLDSKLSLEKISTTPNGAKRIPANNVERGIGSVDISPARPNLLLQSFLNPRLFIIRGLRNIGFLRLCGSKKYECYNDAYYR
jgi:hypothetical protein